jgi:protein farnesyltransferase subunit beta
MSSLIEGASSKKIYDFFMSLKQPDGSFLVMRDGEVDVRGVYCMLVVATLLDLLTPELVAGTAQFIASCQTYEGGFASASQPYYGPPSTAGGEPDLLQTPRPPLGEAHGGYAFCAMASWVMLQPFLDDPRGTPSAPRLNKRTLLRWLTHMQGSEIELGGFRGRTNKLVDGCYAWWVGGAFGLLPAMGLGDILPPPPSVPQRATDGDAEDKWEDVDGVCSLIVTLVRETERS